MVHTHIDLDIAQREAWALRRQKGIPDDRRLFVLACMDERIPVNEALGIRLGDAHIYRNAGGIVTDDVIRSAMLTTQFFGTKEIVIVNHTECGMLSATGDFLTDALRQKGIDVDNVPIDPALPDLKLPQGRFSDWIRMQENIDETSRRQVELLANHPLIPDDVVVHGYVWEVETMRLRKAHERLAEKVNTARQLGAKGLEYSAETGRAAPVPASR